jgi:hypothetical protein
VALKLFEASKLVCLSKSSIIFGKKPSPKVREGSNFPFKYKTRVAVADRDQYTSLLQPYLLCFFVIEGLIQ